jgi:transmembrane sensor
MKEENYLAKWAEGTLSDKELSKLEPKQDPVLLKKILSTTASATIEIPKTLNYENLKSRTSNDTSKNRKGFLLQLAAAVATIILASSIYFNSEVSITSQSGIEKITLPDDSEVTLMPGSELNYKRSYGWLSRGIEFSGEGIFEVTKGKPFTVNTSNGTVKVLGTVFRVISNSSMPFSVSCLEGKVKVQDQYILTANQHYNESRKEVEDVTDMKAFLSDEGIYYYQVPLTQVIQILERYMEIEIKEDFNQEFVFTGILPIYELESALQSISLPFNLTITKLDKLTYRIND